MTRRWGRCQKSLSVDEAFFRDYHRIKNSGLSLIDAENHAKCASHVMVGMAIYMDYLLALRPGRKNPDLSEFVSPAERLQWLVHNVYWSLTTSDQYVWCYSEKMDWWGTMAGKIKYGDWVPPGAGDAIRSARRKIEQGLPLGFNTDKIMEKAWKGRKAYKPPAEKKAAKKPGEKKPAAKN